MCWQISFFCYKNCTVLKYKNHHYWIFFKRKSEKDIKKKQQLLSQIFFLIFFTCNNLKSRAGFALTLRSFCDSLYSVSVSTQQIQDTAVVGRWATRLHISHTGSCIDHDSHGILILNPGDQSLVGATVQWVVLDYWSTGSCTQNTLQMCWLKESFWLSNL